MRTTNETTLQSSDPAPSPTPKPYAVPRPQTVDHAVVLNVHNVDLAAGDDVASATHAGPSDDFQTLHSLYSRRLYRTILAITKNHQDAEDALQNTFLRAYVSMHKFEGRSNIYSWLTRIAINSALMILRKLRTRPEVLFDPQPDHQLECVCFELRDSAPSPEDACYLNQRHRETLRAVRRLDPHLRAPLWMQSMHGWSVNEISRALNISEAAVKARLHRARQRLSAIHDLHRSVRLSKKGAYRPSEKRQPTP